MKLTLAMLLAALITGCAQIQTRVTWQKDREGVLVQVLEISGAPCPAELYARGNDGCALQEPVRVVFYRGEEARQHELEHIGGMVHGPWNQRGDRLCTTILQPGHSGMNAGDELCRQVPDAHVE